MTCAQMNSIRAMRYAGKGYGTIASELGMPEGSVKTFCRKNGLTSVDMQPDAAGRCAPATTCAHCGGSISSARKTRRFCSDQCRIMWWQEHPEHIVRRTIESKICLGCGVVFESYPSSHRAYCSHSCYISSRFGGSGNADQGTI